MIGSRFWLAHTVNLINEDLFFHLEKQFYKLKLVGINFFKTKSDKDRNHKTANFVLYD